MDAVAKPSAAALHVLRLHADAVLTAVGCAEGESALGLAALRDDTVVVVKRFLDGYVYGDVLLGEERLCGVVPGFGMVVAWFCVLVFCCCSIIALQPLGWVAAYPRPKCPLAIPRRSTL